MNRKQSIAEINADFQAAARVNSAYFKLKTELSKAEKSNQMPEDTLKAMRLKLKNLSSEYKKFSAHRQKN